MQPSLLRVVAYAQAGLRLHQHPVPGCAEWSGCLLPVMHDCPGLVDAVHLASVDWVHRARAKEEVACRLDLVAMRQDALAERRHQQHPAVDAGHFHQGIRYRDTLRTAYRQSYRFRHMRDKPCLVEVEAECRHAENWA